MFQFLLANLSISNRTSLYAYFWYIHINRYSFSSSSSYFLSLDRTKKGSILRLLFVFLFLCFCFLKLSGISFRLAFFGWCEFIVVFVGMQEWRGQLRWKHVCVVRKELGFGIGKNRRWMIVGVELKRRVWLRMGNKLGRRRQVVEDKYTRPQGLYQHKDVDHKKLRKLILDSKLAPCYPGDEEATNDFEECPICFLVSTLLLSQFSFFLFSFSSLKFPSMGFWEKKLGKKCEISCCSVIEGKLIIAFYAIGLIISLNYFFWG